MNATLVDDSNVERVVSWLVTRFGCDRLTAGVLAAQLRSPTPGIGIVLDDPGVRQVKLCHNGARLWTLSGVDRVDAAAFAGLAAR